MNNIANPIKFGIMNLRSYICEKLAPKLTEFGTDLTNNEWRDIGNKFKITFMKSNDTIFVIVYKNGHIGFGYKVVKNSSLEDVKSYKDLETYFRFENRKSQIDAMKIFNKILYVILNIIHIEAPKEIYFNANYDDLRKFYVYIVNDKNFLKTIQLEGYTYKGFEPAGGSSTPVHIFRK